MSIPCLILFSLVSFFSAPLRLCVRFFFFPCVRSSVELTRSAGERKVAPFVRITLAHFPAFWHPPTLVRPRFSRRTIA